MELVAVTTDVIKEEVQQQGYPLRGILHYNTKRILQQLRYISFVKFLKFPVTLI